MTILTIAALLGMGGSLVIAGAVLSVYVRYGHIPLRISGLMGHKPATSLTPSGAQAVNQQAKEAAMTRWLEQEEIIRQASATLNNPRMPMPQFDHSSMQDLEKKYVFKAKGDKNASG
jgi:hypothetical protein